MNLRLRAPCTSLTRDLTWTRPASQEMLSQVTSRHLEAPNFFGKQDSIEMQTADAPGGGIPWSVAPRHQQGGNGQTSHGQMCWTGQGQAVTGREAQLGTLVVRGGVGEEGEQSHGGMCVALSKVLKRPAAPLSYAKTRWTQKNPWSDA